MVSRVPADVAPGFCASLLVAMRTAAEEEEVYNSRGHPAVERGVRCSLFRSRTERSFGVPTGKLLGNITYRRSL